MRTVACFCSHNTARAFNDGNETATDLIPCHVGLWDWELGTGKWEGVRGKNTDIGDRWYLGMSCQHLCWQQLHNTQYSRICAGWFACCMLCNVQRDCGGLTQQMAAAGGAGGWAPPGGRHEYYLVKNLNGTAGRLCRCGSWIEHWRRETKSRRTRCAALGCTNEDLVGAHVQIDDGRSSREWWIVPLCRGHNSSWRTAPIWLEKTVSLVSADRAGMGCL